MRAWATRAATLDDATHVYDHLWARGAEELAGYGVTREKWVAQWAYMTLIPNCTCAFLHDGSVVAVLGADRDGDEAQTWFQATAEFDRLGRGLTREMRRVLGGLALRASIQRAVLKSLCISPDAPKWYEFLGFSESKETGKRFGARVERTFVREY